MSDEFSPRVVQARIRAGASVEVVAAETSWPIDKVQRYAGPPLAERAFVAEQAQGVTLHRHGHTLADLADQAIQALALSPVRWDAFRTDDARWSVTATTDGHQALWTFDPTSRTVHAQNAFARVLMGLDETTVVEQRPHLVAVPHHDESADDAPDREDVQAPPPNPGGATQSDDRASVPSARQDTITLPLGDVPSAEPAKKRTRGKRASVPSWDEILFGAQRGHDES
jgi:hypothetical protein